MKTLRTALTSALLIGCAHQAPNGDTDTSPVAEEDPYLWLEDVEGDKALDWVRGENQRTAERLEAHPDFKSFLTDARAALDAPSRIPHVTARAGKLYNFWRDAEHVRGIYRRTTLDELKKPAPKWETVLDIDALSEAEGKKWVLKGMSCLPPKYQRCLVRLSPGGGDAYEVREFDSTTLQFVKDGFTLPAAKHNVEWIDENSLYVATDYGDGSLTDSGYPRIVKIWKRGTPLSEATTLFEGAKENVGSRAKRYRTDDGNIDVLREWLSYWESNYFLVNGTKLTKLDLPVRSQIVGAFRGQLLVALKDDFRDVPSGSLITVRPKEGGFDIGVVAKPTDSEIVVTARDTKQGVVVEILDDVRGRLYRYAPDGDGWKRTPVEFPDNGSVHVESVDDDTGDLFVAYESFTTSPTLYHVPAATLTAAVVRKQDPAFDESKFAVKQHWATSKDGTKVPYFVVMSKDTKLDGTNPTHIFSYGGFRVPLTPSYSGSYEALFGAYGKLWLERGGVFVSASIRGGGEFGPKWHEAALLENRPRAFEDFEAVAEDLVKKKITSPKHIGIEGRSNGGLLVTATMIRRPDLYGAVICGVPLADMKRYHKLLAGASWMGEYGNPDKPEDWAFISKYSPYQNLEAGKSYPKVLFYTSTKDDRVHPGHARKMAARMKELGYETGYYENIEGGHGGSSTNDQLAYRLALAYAHLWSTLR